MIPSSMPPQALTQAARVLGGVAASMETTVAKRSHMTPNDSHVSLSNGHSNGHAVNSEEDTSSSDDEFEGQYGEERSRSDALKLLRKMKRKSPLSKSEKKARKKPRLALRTEFLESDASESELSIVRGPKKNQKQGGVIVHSTQKKPSRNFLEEEDSDLDEPVQSSGVDGGVEGNRANNEGLSGEAGVRRGRFESDEDLSEEEGRLSIAV